MPSCRLVATLLALASLVLLAFTAPASAAPARSLQSSFASVNSAALAVDQASGDIYVVDPADQQIRRYSAAGDPAPFSALAGSNVIDGAGGADATPAAGFAFDLSSQVAIDNSGGPTDGNIYVADPGSHGVVDIFSFAGEYLGQLNGSSTPQGNWHENFGYPCGVAVTPSGVVYVSGAFNGTINRYTPSGPVPTDADYASQASEVYGCALATDSAGSVYEVQNVFGGAGSLTKYSPSELSQPAPTGTLITEEVTAVGVDPSSNDVYADKGSSIQVFDSSGNLSYTFGSSADFGTSSAGVAVKGAEGSAYVADPTNGEIDAYGLNTAYTDLVSGADHHTNATLHGHIEPHGDTITNCQFDWGTTVAYGNAADCAEGDSFTAPASVSAFLNDLDPGVTIHYRLHLTTVAHGEVLGADREFAPTQAVVRELADTIGSAGSGADQLSPDAEQVAVDQSSGDVYVADTGNHRVVKYDEDGNFLWAAGRDVVASGPDNVPGVNEIQQLTVEDANGGTFALKFEGNSTSPEIPFNAPASAVQAALGGLPNLDPGDVQVTGASGGPYTIEFTGARGGTSVEQLGVSPENLTAAPPASFASASIQTTQEGGAFEICRPSDICRAGAPGSTPGQFDVPRKVAVDSSGGPSDGDVYVLDYLPELAEPGNHTITKLSPSGEVVSAWGSDGQLRSIQFPRGLAVDSAGSLRVLANNFLQPDEIQVRSGAKGDLLEAVTEVGYSGESFAIEPGGTYLEFGGAQYGGGQVQRFDPTLPSGVFTNNFAVSKRGAGNGMALDPSSADLYVVDSSHIGFYRFDPAGNVIEPDLSACAPQLRIFGPGEGTEGCEPTETFGEGDLTAGQSIDINGATRKFYVLDSGQLKIFNTFDISPPTVTLQDASGLTGTTTILNGKVDPEGIEVSNCNFAYVDEGEFQANGFANATSVPCAPDPGSGSGDVPVSAELTGLAPGTTYHFRIEAENATPHSVVVSLDRSFTSRGPIVTNPHANPVTATDATLRATINPQGTQTTYHFDYGPTPSYGSSTPESTAIGGSGNQAVAEKIDDLAPGTTYHFHVVARNADATVASPDVTFTTTGTTDSCPNAALRSGFGFALPDCRAYEQASQVDKNSANALTDEDTVAAVDGSGITWAVVAGVPTTGGASQPTPVVSRRLNGAWVTNGLIPLTAVNGTAAMSGVDPNLTTSFSTNTQDGTFQVGDTAAGTWTSPFAATEAPSGGARASIPSFSDDSAHFLLASPSVFAPGAISGKLNLYESNHDSVTLVSRVPVFPATSCDDEGGPACVVASNGIDTTVPTAISGDGSRIVFVESGSGRIYLREGAKTTQVSASQASTPDPHGHQPATLRAVSHDGSRIYFTSCEKLTDDSTAVSTPASTCAEGSDLYSYDADSGALSDLTVDGTDRIQVFDSSGASRYTFGSAADFGPDPAGVAVKGTGGRAYVADRTNGEIDVFKQEPGARSYESSFGKGSFPVDSPGSLAVDQSSGDVYAVQAGGSAAEVSRFDADGNPKDFTAGPDAGSNTLTGDSFFAGGEPEVAIDNSEVAIDNSGGPADGDVYVPVTVTTVDPESQLPTESSAIAVYASDGAPLGTLDGSPRAKYGRACGVAVDQSTGDLYVGDAGGRIWRYSPSAATVTNADYSGGIRFNGEFSPCDLAADSGNIYAVPRSGGAVTRYAASAFAPGATPPSVTGVQVAANATAIATDPSTGDLYVDEGDLRSADVKGVFGASPDGSYVYFIANGRLAPGAPAGKCNAGGGNEPVCELYLSHDGGAPVNVATVSRTGEENAEVAADGTLLFTSNQQLTDYDNVGPVCIVGANEGEGPGPCHEIYRYRPGDPGVTCVSCSPAGDPPVGSADTVGDDSAAFFQKLETPTSKRALSADGNRVFFQTPDALVSRDVNGEGGCPLNNRRQHRICTDVYEWQAAGTGSCDSAAENGGCLHLISTGTSSTPVFFAAASASGDDVFIRTTDRLVPQDRDDLYDVYDARIDGGLAYQHVTSPPPCGGAEQCRAQGTAAPPANGAGSAAFEGPGNPPAQAKKTCPKGKQKVRRSGKTHCVKRQTHKHKHKRSHKRASANPGGSK